MGREETHDHGTRLNFINDNVTVALCITAALFPWICGDYWTSLRDVMLEKERHFMCFVRSWSAPYTIDVFPRNLSHRRLSLSW